MNISSQSVTIIAHQLPLYPPLPRVIGPVEFTEFCALWERVESLLNSGVERDFVMRCLARKMRRRRMTASEQQTFQLESRQALRCTLARLLLQESLRHFSCHLAESPVLQRFCLLWDLESSRIPGHSQLQRYFSWLPEEDMRPLIVTLIQQAQSADAPATLGLEKPVDLQTVWVDSTCAETNIHHPVDWVLLRDAVRTLIQAIQVLRAHHLKHRMPDPRLYLSAMNKLCIRMTHSGKGEKGRQRQKALLREMKTLVQVVEAHAKRYVALVEDLPEARGWALGARRRIESVLTQLPAARHQAHERIIGERPVANADKVLSLYEPDTALLMRGKAGAMVEFGHSLLLVEQRDGLILDWALPRRPQSDRDLLQDGIVRWQHAYGKNTIKTAVTDRGFDGPETRVSLRMSDIANGMCPRSPRQLAERMENPTFRAQQCRRAQTEGRIAIVKQTFWGGRLHTKGYEHHVMEVAWTILAHNLWVLARLPTASEYRMAA